ncbi:YcgJ family protein [Bordetella holmesii]|uniref:Fels-1 prophage protein-like protein n=2 Tax=Bordetella holmesii TaxID=35814 RepID=A0A158M6A2_9BORD|nr:YcgJ family protein [Bordetella holmesii]AHV92803.1 fels-1 Prophage Protein-like family protein [Bordetella holmesii ATCC 51541]AIT25566.1 fels-1 Prophage Protein-like family protein [Bordetella holmesii 44057]EWM43524.1 fels-1 Prophage Protein-like family protein [Bordetella holmesii 41130]EWM46133.1 fels-1 Prophage Protein-like family protein [Bordetella holmesii 35009]EWM50287.1 fels-1 Prophage Protein-like family protein [Bordetella holmesii 70147]
MKKRLSIMALALAAAAVQAAPAKPLRTPQAGVLCDSHFCADARGLSTALTQKYLGAQAAGALREQGAFDHQAFTYENGVFCDTRERLCRENRYFGSDGKRSAAVEPVFTRLLFPE